MALQLSPQGRQIRSLFGQRFRKHREMLGLTRRDAAGKIGMSWQTIQSWESGTTFIEDMWMYRVIDEKLGFDVCGAIKECLYEIT